jgi:hypothetical protein
MVWLNDLKTKINQISMNSCDISSAIVGGLASRNAALRDHWCKMDGNRVGRFSDLTAGRVCHNPDVAQDVEHQARRDGKTELTDNFNLAFEAIKRSDFLQAMDMQMQNLVMAITGTIIVRDGEITQEAGQITTGLQALLAGGSVPGIQCLDDDCLSYRPSSIDIAHERSMTGLTYALLRTLADAAIHGERISSDDMNRVNSFLSKSHFPIYNNIVANISATGGISHLKLQEYSEVLSIDLVSEFLIAIVQEMLDGLQRTKAKIAHDDMVVDFKDSLKQIIAEIRKTRNQIYRKAGVNSRMQQETRFFQQYAMSNVDLAPLM